MTAIEAIDEWEEYPLGKVIGKAGRDLFGRSNVFSNDRSGAKSAHASYFAAKALICGTIS